MRMRHFFISLLLLMLACLASSCVSRIMYEDGEFDGSDVIENADDIWLFLPFCEVDLCFLSFVPLVFVRFLCVSVLSVGY